MGLIDNLIYYRKVYPASLKRPNKSFIIRRGLWVGVKPRFLHGKWPPAQIVGLRCFLRGVHREV